MNFSQKTLQRKTQKNLRSFIHSDEGMITTAPVPVPVPVPPPQSTTHLSSPSPLWLVVLSNACHCSMIQSLRGGGGSPLPRTALPRALRSVQPQARQVTHAHTPAFLTHFVPTLTHCCCSLLRIHCSISHKIAHRSRATSGPILLLSAHSSPKTPATTPKTPRPPVASPQPPPVPAPTKNQGMKATLCPNSRSRWTVSVVDRKGWCHLFFQIYPPPQGLLHAVASRAATPPPPLLLFHWGLSSHGPARRPLLSCHC